MQIFVAAERVPKGSPLEHYFRWEASSSGKRRGERVGGKNGQRQRQKENQEEPHDNSGEFKDSFNV